MPAQLESEYIRTISKLELRVEDLLDQKASLCGSYQQLMEDYQALEIKYGILLATTK
jgi:hypothetical protein